MVARVRGARPENAAVSRKGAQRARKLRGELPPKKKPKNKFNSRGEWIDGVFFRSRAEAERYRQLQAIEATGLITRLELQPAYPVVVNNKLCCRYVADFRYDVIDDRGTVLKQVVEDVKGMVTPYYKLKKKLVLATHGIDICEIPAALIKKWELRIP